MNSFFNSVDLLQKTLGVLNLRQQVTANNIANSETPNYKRQVVNFESELKRAFESEAKSKDAFHMTTTDSRHIKSEEPRDWRTVDARRVTDYATSLKGNGNNVDAETEAMEIARIQMQYRLLAQVESFEYSQLGIAMKKI